MRIHVADGELGAVGSLGGHDQSGVYGRAVCDGFVGREGSVGFFTGQFLEHFLNHGHTGQTADQQKAGDVIPFQVSFLHEIGHGKAGAIEEIGGHLFKLRASKGDLNHEAGVFEGDCGLIAHRQGAFCIVGLA